MAENKSKTLDDYVKDIVKALKEAGNYSKSLGMQVRALATAMRTLDLANKEIDGLTSTTVWETTRYGEKLAPHPVFKIQKDAQDSVTRQMKALGLTAEELGGGEADDDPLVELTKKVNSAGKNPVIVKPKK